MQNKTLYSWLPLFVLSFVLGIFSPVNAQQKTVSTATKDTILTNIVTANNLKSGNWQDVMSSFFQVAASNLTGPKKTFNFQSTLFAIKSKVDSSILVDTNYIHHRLDRNIQFNFSLGLDSNYHFSGFAGGVTWAVVNKRDSTVLSLVGSKADDYFHQFADSLFDALQLYRRQFTDSANRFLSKDDSIQYVTAGDSLTKMLATDTSFNENRLPSGFVTFLKNHNFPSNAYDMVMALYRSALQATRIKPLLTLSLNSAFTKNAGFDSAQFGLVYLEGLTKTGRELDLDLRGNFIVKDSAVGGEHYRSRFNATGGLDYALISLKDSKSGAYTPIFEIKPYLEYDHIFSALLSGENRDQLYVAAELRLKVTGNLWIPITLKYGVNGKKNFLGFLNLAFNMNSFKTPSTPKQS